MFTVQMTVTIVLQVLNHLLRRPANPPGSLGLRSLIPAKGTEVLSLGFDYPASVVVGKRVFRVFGTGFGFGFVGISVGKCPRVRGDVGAMNGGGWILLNFVGFEGGEIKWDWREEGRFERLHGRVLE